MNYYKKGDKPQYKKRFKKIIGVLLLIFGVGVAGYFFFPVLSYQLFLANAYEGGSIESSVPKHLLVKNTGDFGSLISQGINSLTSDFTDARNWYPKLSHEDGKRKVDAYRISIPKLGIENAEVSTRDYNLDKHLVQYFGTAIPGEKGTAVIFGHSTIPAWFDPTNYKKIFATLHTIKVGDEIEAKVGDVTYKYKIFSIIITSPKDTSILTQSYDNSYLTIVTCTPPGTLWKRLIVRAALEVPGS